MRTPLAVRAAAAATIAGTMILLAAGCARADGAPAADPTPYQYDPDAVVLRVQHVGGFVTPTMLLKRLPMVTYYGDGRVITEGPQIAIFPAPALPNVQVQQIDPAHLDTLVTRALDAGVGTKPDLGEPGVADLPTTRFTVFTSNGTQTLDAYALTDGELPGLGKEQQAARKKLLDLQATLTDPTGVLGKGTIGDSVEYKPTVLAAIASKWVGTDTVGSKVHTWPGPPLPGTSMGQGLDLGCVTVTGTMLDSVLAAARDTNEQTIWKSGDKLWFLAFRPLLPDERDCSSLQLQG
jgi:hypothetical protein